MKRNLFLLTVAMGALGIFNGCQSGSSGSSKPATSALPSTGSAPAKSLLPPIRINVGGGAVKDSAGVSWLAETGFSGGEVIERPDLAIANTTQPEIYRSEHYSMESFTHKLPNGKYQVKLHFCETFEGITGPGERVFSFDVEGKQFKDFDVWVKSGGFARAHVVTVPVEITDGQLDIKFTSQVENPQINGVEIIAEP
jgi:hypothetical protein